MCGIIGFIKIKGRQVENKEEDDKYVKFATFDLLMRSVSRGSDATGVSFINSEGKLIHFKRDIESTNPEFLEKVEELLDTHGVPEVMTMHTRAHTQGSPTNNDNNHPVISHDGKISVVHNGMIYNDYLIRKELPKEFRCKAEVDSEVIVRLIESKFAKKEKKDDESWIESIRESTKEMAGGFACAVLNEEFPTTLTLFRHGNPIVLCGDLKHQILWFASTEGILSGISGLRQLIWKIFGVNNTKDFYISDLPDNKMIVISQHDAENFKTVIKSIDYSSAVSKYEASTYKKGYPYGHEFAGGV